jgi:hypothetical protein
MVGLFLGAMIIVNVGCMQCGCGESITEKIAETAMEKAVEVGTGGKGKIDVGKDVDLSGLPAEARYPGAKGTGRFAISTGDGSGVTYSLETGDAPAKVLEWYKASAEKAGWKKVAEMETGEATMVTFGKEEEKKFMNATVTTDKGKTTIAIIYGEDAK